MGDSNMRHTYYWWTTQRQGALTTTKEFGLDRADLGYSGRWADQEAILEQPNGKMIRSSFRFLHGPWDEIEFSFNHWHTARKATYGWDEEAKASMRIDTKWDERGDYIRPSPFAQWATQQQLVIDYERNNAAFAQKAKSFVDDKPDVVVLTEGWGGIPNCKLFQSIIKLFSEHPDIRFVWAPIYVTNRQEARHQCFAGLLREFAMDNVKIVDFWDDAQRLPQTGGLYHIGTGGSYMRKAVKRFEDAMCAL